jgi:tetratricopeptide (TPR) repeat protein
MKTYLSAALAAGLAFCAAAIGAEKAETKKYDINVVVDTDTIGSSPEAGAIWVAYAMARSKALIDRGDRGEALTAGDDYDVELAGREMLALEELAKGADAKSAPYFELVRKLKAAGFLDEYVIGAFAIPGWTIPADAIKAFDFEGFRAFVKTNPLGDYHPTGAYTAVAGKRWPDAPGEKLKDPKTLKIMGPDCAQTQKSVAAELAAWDTNAATLRGVPVAADSRGELIRALSAMAKDGAIPQQGVTWVSSRPAWLAYFSGFCGVELKDPASAEAPLRKAIALRPMWASARTELTSVMIMLKNLPEAEKHIEGAIAVSTDRCELAAVHRRRGYIRIDQGRLLEARADYRKSLEYAPGNELALHELKVIDNELQKQGKAGEGSDGGEAWTPPPAGNTVVTKC